MKSVKNLMRLEVQRRNTMRSNVKTALNQRNKEMFKRKSSKKKFQKKMLIVKDKSLRVKRMVSLQKTLLKRSMKKLTKN